MTSRSEIPSAEQETTDQASLQSAQRSTKIQNKGDVDKRQSTSNDLSAINESLEKWLSPRDGCPERLLEAMRYAVLGPGKRLRPRLALLAANACDGDSKQALPAACAVEMIHAYSLIHDDLPAMDDDDLRRGRPTVHKQFDEATAILAGDALQALAFEVLATGIPTASIAATACAELARVAGPSALVGGQADDLAGLEGVAQASDEAKLEKLRAIHRRKTAAMITVSLRLGALAVEANQEQLLALTAYGEAIGLAFQVTDDLLDATGDESAVGKRTGKDLERGKLTYPGLMGLEASHAYATQLINQAVDSIKPFSESAEPLRQVALQILERKK